MREYGKKNIPCRATIKNIVSKFRNTDSVCDKEQVHKILVLTETKLKEIEQSFIRGPETGLKKEFRNCQYLKVLVIRRQKFLRYFPIA
jgi:hypothetical protein